MRSPDPDCARTRFSGTEFGTCIILTAAWRGVAIMEHEGDLPACVCAHWYCRRVGSAMDATRYARVPGARNTVPVPIMHEQIIQ